MSGRVTDIAAWYLALIVPVYLGPLPTPPVASPLELGKGPRHPR